MREIERRECDTLAAFARGCGRRITANTYSPNSARLTMAPRTKKTPMSDTHKEALAEGRNHARIVGRYLEALEANKPKRGRKRTAETVKKRLAAVAVEIKDAAGLARLNLLQERRDLEVELATMQGAKPDTTELEKDFAKVAKAYSAKKRISYGAWREFGVPPEVLKKAGITRGA
jgi:hypothetical protein